MKEVKLNKINKYCKIGTVLVSVMQFAFALILWWNGIRSLALYHIFTVSFYLVMVVLISKTATEHSKKEWKDVTIDEITDMYNSKYFLKNVGQILKSSNEKYYLIYTDILNFSLYNKIFGDEKGNKLLKEFTQVLKGLNNTDAVYGRLFVDEFGVLIPESAYDENFLRERIGALQDEFSSSIYQVYAYAGIYKIQDNKESAKSICVKAKIAMDTIKGDYNEIIAYYDENMLKETLTKQKIIGEFHQALQEGQFCIFLQPQMTSDGELLGAEALVRWKHPREGMVPPDKFIPVLEETSMITMLDCFVWEQAAKLLQEWKMEGKSSTYISVNISTMDFFYTDIYKTFTSLVEKYEISPSNLKIEITETALMSDTQTHMKVLEKLQAYGFEVELDDFGNGYSSLSMLKDIMVDVIKIDMGFLDKTENEKRSWSILQSVMNMAEDLGIKTITEGVETEQQVNSLSDIGCKVFQGYYFAKPMDIEDFTLKYLSL